MEFLYLETRKQKLLLKNLIKKFPFIRLGIFPMDAKKLVAKGETIKSVRFMGDTGYVVTFEQTDPLFVIDLQNHITNNYYNCSNEMLNNLGCLYVSDIRFKENIDKVAGNGTSEFVSEAIKYYCNKGCLYEN